MNDPKAPSRKTIVEKTKVVHYPTDGPIFKTLGFAEEDAPDGAWCIFLTTKTGLLPSKVITYLFCSEADVESFIKQKPVGSEIADSVDCKAVAEFETEILHRIMKSGSLFGVNAGDEESPLAFEVLDNAGIYQEEFGPLSQDVLDFLGNERVAEIKNDFGENWSTAAAFEYCWRQLPHSSAAFIAASYQFHHYISGDNFSAGYLWRDLEVLVHGVEDAATNAFKMRQKAGKAGSEKSKMARGNRIESLLTAMEYVALRNPDVVKLGDKTLAALALSECSEAEPALWSQGKGQAMEYVGEIRRGEAGTKMQARYHAVFGTKPPKRFQRIRDSG